MKFQLHERIFYDILPPGTIGKMGLHPTKLEEMARVSLRNTLRGNPKTKLRSLSNSVFFPSNNEKRATQAQRNLLKREQSKPEHNSPKRYIEVGMNSLHRIQAAYIPVHRGSRYAPPQRIPRGEEVESSEPRKRGSMEERGSAESISFVLWCAARQQ